MNKQRTTRRLSDLSFPQKDAKTVFLTDRNLPDDPDAIAKFVFFLISKQAASFYQSFQRMFRPEARLGSIANDDTGWEIERRVEEVSPDVYADWPKGSEFRISVDPRSLRCEPQAQEAFYDREAFLAIVDVMLEAAGMPPSSIER